jgi:hypothetical protein
MGFGVGNLGLAKRIARAQDGIIGREFNGVGDAVDERISKINEEVELRDTRIGDTFRSAL